MVDRVININGVFYVSRVNENGIYMERVEADGTPWVDPKPGMTEAEINSSISLGPVAPKTVLVVPAVVAPKRPWWKFWG
jgi:hypothetical protein